MSIILPFIWPLPVSERHPTTSLLKNAGRQPHPPHDDPAHARHTTMSTRLALAFSLSLAGLTPAQPPDLYDIGTVRDIYLTFNQPNWWTLLINNYGPEINIPADLRIDNLTLPNVGVRFRGNTSYTMLPPGSEKKSFNIETDAFAPGQDI